MPWYPDLDELALLAEEARSEASWGRLADYYDLRSRGLRRPALQALREFIADTATWPFEARRMLCRWIGERRSRVTDPRLLAPEPLCTDFLTPSLAEWVQREPSSADAHFFTSALDCYKRDADLKGKAYHFRRAIALDPSHDEAKVELARWMIAAVEYEQHELPYWYLGDPAADQRDMAEAESLLQGIRNPADRHHLLDEARQMGAIAAAWQEFRSRAGGDFALWCANNGKGNWFRR